MMNFARILPWYYAGTAFFRLLDYGLGINVRVAFLDQLPTARVMVPNDAIFEENAPFVNVQEIINFVTSGSVAYFAWIKGLKKPRNQ